MEDAQAITGTIKVTFKMSYPHRHSKYNINRYEMHHCTVDEGYVEDHDVPIGSEILVDGVDGTSWDEL